MREKFEQIYTRAADRKGGKAALESLLSAPLSAEALTAIADDRWLAAFTQKVFPVWYELESGQAKVGRF